MKHSLSDNAEHRNDGDGLRRSCAALFAWLVLSSAVASSCMAASIHETIERVQPRMVKLYGAGGVRGLEAYQSGMLISPEGHILTVFSHVLDADSVTAVLSDGRRYEAKLLGADPRLEIAVLKIEAADLPCFDLGKAAKAESCERVLAFSNIFGTAGGDEPVSVQKGIVAAVARLDARRGVFETPYRGSVYVVDMTTNNSGAAGGAMVNHRGELLGVLGKELRNAQNNTWLNYAIPIEAMHRSVEEIRAGKFVARRESETSPKTSHPINLTMLGIVLVPNVLERTPPYVDQVLPDSPAAKAGVRPDDLVVMLSGRLVQSCKSLIDDLETIDEEDEVELTLLRGQELLEVTLRRTETPAAGKEQP